MYMNKEDDMINMEKAEVDHNSAADIIGSGPAYIGYTLLEDMPTLYPSPQPQ